MMVRRKYHKSEVFAVWYMWLLCVLFYMYQYVARSAFPNVLKDEYASYFNLDMYGVSKLIASYYLIYTLIQIPSGLLLDRFGARRCAGYATLVCALGVLLFVVTQYSAVATVGQMLIGAGSAFALISTFKLINEWFPPSQIAAMTSLTLAIGVGGPIVFGPLVGWLKEHVSWLSMFYVFVVIGAILAAAILISVREARCIIVATDIASGVRAVFGSLKIILSNCQIWMLFFYTMMMYAPMSVVTDCWGASYLQSLYGIEITEAVFINNMAYIGFCAGIIFFTWLLYKMRSYKKPSVLASFLSVFSLSCVLFLCDVPVFVMSVYLILMGFSVGGILAFAMVSEMLDASLCATASAWINMGSMLSGVILQPVVGYVLSTRGAAQCYSVADYRVALCIVLGCVVCAMCLSWCIKDVIPGENVR